VAATDSHEVDIQGFLAVADSGSPLLVLDVRNEEEFTKWKIEARHPISTINIPYFDFIEDTDAAMKRLPPNGDKEIVVVCAKGGSSAMVVELLRAEGVPASNLRGGMVAYGEYLQPVEVRLTGASNLRLWQIHRRGKGCLSYIAMADGESIVVDPARDIHVYESLAAGQKAKIVRVLETHVHADHVSGGPELSRRHNASYSAGASPECDPSTKSKALRDGEVLVLGAARIEVLHTPGHTPGSVCYLLNDSYLFSGDTLFVNSVGRPDLGGDVLNWSAALFTTLTRRLTWLDDEVTIFPAHSAGSSEIGGDGLVSTKLGDLRQRMPEFHMTDERAFCHRMQAAASAPPASYNEIIRVNLGQATASPEKVTEWELGKNQCAAPAVH
jgi:glyoxylase-like metal-dependent hydrolase (beta-lactamase superfamily II)/rhodanese-related sulfurtransferase